MAFRLMVNNARGVIFALLLSGCAGMPLADIWREGSPLDYTRLFSIASHLVSIDKAKNIEGLNAIIGSQNTERFLMWYEALKLTWNAAKSITHKSTSRDIRVNACVSLYNAEVIYE
jgi:hypothetical protein